MPTLSRKDAKSLGIDVPAENKYGVSAKEDRTWRGRVYDSKAEMMYAQTLDGWRQLGLIREFVEQVRVFLVEGFSARIDFLVIPVEDEPYYADVKGKDTQRWRDTKRLWASHGRLRLDAVKRKGGRFEVVESIEPHPQEVSDG